MAASPIGLQARAVELRYKNKIADDAAAALSRASDEADGLGHEWWIGCEHLLLGLLSDKRSLAGRVLAHTGVDIESARAAVRRICGATEGMERPEYSGKTYTTRATVVCRVAEIEAERLGAGAPGTGHYLLALLTEGQSVAVRALVELRVDLEKLRGEVLGALGVAPDTRDRYVSERQAYLTRSSS